MSGRAPTEEREGQHEHDRPAAEHERFAPADERCDIDRDEAAEPEQHDIQGSLPPYQDGAGQGQAEDQPESGPHEIGTECDFDQGAGCNGTGEDVVATGPFGPVRDGGLGPE